MHPRFHRYIAAAVLGAILGVAEPALSQTTPQPPQSPAPATEDQSAGQSFSNAWTDLKSSADNAWQGLARGTNAAVQGVKEGWQTTKARASQPSSGQPAKQP